MQITPERRQRILKAQHLRQQGQSLRKIAEQLGVSHATVIADLKLLETHWSEIAAAAADDLLIEQMHHLRQYLAHVLGQDLAQLFAGSVSPAEYARLYTIRAGEISTLLRETRQTANTIYRRAAQRSAEEPDIDISDQPAELSQEAVGTPLSSSPELTNANHSNQRISQPEQEIVDPDRSEKTSANHPKHPQPGDIADESDEQAQAILDDFFATALAEHPHLKGQNSEAIFAFLEQLPPEQLPAPPQTPITHTLAAAG